MKIYYIANVRLPSEKAHGIQIMKTCEALASLGHTVTLVLPKRKNLIQDDPFTYYGVAKNFSLQYVRAFNILRLGKIGFWLQTLLFSEFAVWKMRKDWPDVIYSRDELILLNFLLIHPNLVFEAHRGNRNKVVRLLLSKVKVVTITHALARLYSNYTKKLLVAPDAVEIEKFNITLSKSECRERCGLPQHKKIALYAGHLYEWKGAQTFADASSHFNDNELAVFVGGTSYDVKDFVQKNKDNTKMLVLGQKPYESIPYFMKAADVLVLPNSAKVQISRDYTSPMKLFEYMASGNPIVASDLPSLREVISEEHAVFVKPDDEKVLHEGIQKLFADPELGTRISKNAFLKVKDMTWSKRAEHIAQFIQP